MYKLLAVLFCACLFPTQSFAQTKPKPKATKPSGPASCAAGQRRFLVQNNLATDMWLGVTAGTLSCKTDSDCPTQAAGSCVGADPPNAGVCHCPTGNECGALGQCSASNKMCYWNLPQMDTTQLHLQASTSAAVCFPAAGATSGIQWSGSMYARTGCDSNGQNCQTGECGSAANQPCPTGQGGNPPATTIEFTLSNFALTSNPDFYDISIINGVNVAASMSPVAKTFQATAKDPYSCGSPGSSNPSAPLSPCTWKIQPVVGKTDQSAFLADVAPVSFSGKTCPVGLNGSAPKPNSLGFCPCTATSDCSSAGLACGLAMNADANIQFANVCGNKIGWWTADQICGASINTKSPFGVPFNCASTVKNTDNSTSTYTNLYACTQSAGAANKEQAQSCYTAGAAADCCGCATSAQADHQDWPSVLGPSFGGPDHGCFNNNPNWVTYTQPWLVFLKKACPTAYTYPFDDATSTFTCQGSGKVGPQYQVTFFATQ